MSAGTRPGDDQRRQGQAPGAFRRSNLRSMSIPQFLLRFGHRSQDTTPSVHPRPGSTACTPTRRSYGGVPGTLSLAIRNRRDDVPLEIPDGDGVTSDSGPSGGAIRVIPSRTRPQCPSRCGLRSRHRLKIRLCSLNMHGTGLIFRTVDQNGPMIEVRIVNSTMA